MRRGQLCIATVLVVSLVACGGSDDGGATDEDVEDVTTDDVTPSVTIDEGESEEESEGGSEVTPAVVTSVIEGTAVGMIVGGDEACEEEGVLPVELQQGEPFTIYDASTGEEIGTGVVTATDFQLEGNASWTCNYTITAEVTSVPDEITVQLGDAEFFASLDDGRFAFMVTEELAVETTEPSSTTSVIEGIAVGMIQGGDEACEEEGVLPGALQRGDSFAIFDAATGEEIGIGAVTGTDFQDDDNGLWTCAYVITAEVTSVPDEIAVELGDEVFFASVDDGSFSFMVTEELDTSDSSTTLLED